MTLLLRWSELREVAGGSFPPTHKQLRLSNDRNLCNFSFSASTILLSKIIACVGSSFSKQRHLSCMLLPEPGIHGC